MNPALFFQRVLAQAKKIMLPAWLARQEILKRCWMKEYQKGQALVTLLIFIIISVTITAGATIMIITGSLSTSKLEAKQMVSNIAEGGAENAILRLLRDPNYSGENLNLGNGVAKIKVVSIDSSRKSILSEAELGSFLHKVQVEVSYDNNRLSVLSWKEVL